MKVAGFGFRAQATAESLRSALDAAGGPDGVVCLATVSSKGGGLSELGLALGLPVQPVTPEALAAIATPTRSDASLAAHGTGSVAEAAALAAAGANARLIAPRALSTDRMATCAIAIGDPT